MFERFTAVARRSVAGAVREAEAEGAPQVRPEHLLLAIASSDGEGAQLLRAAGWSGDVDELRARFARTQRRGGLTAQDVEALRAVGVDADALLRRLGVDATAETGTDEVAALRPFPGDGGRHDEHHDALDDEREDDARRVWRGRHRPFSREAKKALEDTLKAAIARGDRRLGEQHLLIGLVARPGRVADELAADGITVERLGEFWRNAS